MDFTHYIFAFFVFLLVCGCIWIFSRVSRGAKKPSDTGSYEKEQRLFKLYQNVEDMMTSFEEYIEETKKEIDGRIARIERLSAGAEAKKPSERKLAAKPDTANTAEDKPQQPNTEAAKKAAAIKKATAAKMPKQVPSVRDLPVEEAIPLLIEQGMTQQQIAKRLGISNREVTLIMGINKMHALK